jgi:EREBP-like factor
MTPCQLGTVLTTCHLSVHVAYDQAAYHRRGDVARLNFPDDAASRATLDPVVNAKLEAISATIATAAASSSKNAARAKSKAVPINAPILEAVASPSSSSSSDEGSGSDDEMSMSSPSPTPVVAELGQLDFGEVPWDEAENFVDWPPCPAVADEGLGNLQAAGT